MTTTLATATTTSGPPPSNPALTTTFTPASSCTNYHMLPYAASGFACMVGDQSSPCQYLHLGPSTTDGCLPSDWSTGTDAYYSPGVCPTGYTEACSNLVSVGTVTETRATCCPRYDASCHQPFEDKTNDPWVSNENWTARTSAKQTPTGPGTPTTGARKSSTLPRYTPTRPTTLTMDSSRRPPKINTESTHTPSRFAINLPITSPRLLQQQPRPLPLRRLRLPLKRSLQHPPQTQILFLPARKQESESA